MRRSYFSKNSRFWFRRILIFLLIFTSEREARGEEDSEDQKKNVLAVIGGSTIDRRREGRYFIDGVAEIEDQFTVETAAGTSPPILKVKYEGIGFYYVKYHGYPGVEAQRFTSGRNFVTMFAAFHKLGVTHIIGGAGSGGIRATYQNGDLVIADDILNFNFERPSSVLAATDIERPGVRARYNPPFCPDIRKILYELASKSYTGRVHPRGTVVQDDSSRYETPAEIRFYRRAGGDIVTHNVVTEAIYARQLGMHYAVINSIANPAEGVGNFTLHEEMGVGDKIAEEAIPIVLQGLLILSEHEPKCGINCTGERY